MAEEEGEAEDEVGLRPYCSQNLTHQGSHFCGKPQWEGCCLLLTEICREGTVAIFNFMVTFGTSYFLLLVLFWGCSSQTKQVLTDFLFLHITLITYQTSPTFSHSHYPELLFFLHDSPCCDVSLLPISVDEQYFTSCHLDLLCLFTPALCIQL